MIRLAAWMLTGNLLLLQLPGLPAKTALGLAILAGVILAMLRRWGPALGLSMFAWTGLVADHALQLRLDSAVSGSDFVVTGRVAEFPRHGRIRSSFEFVVSEAPAQVPPRLRLSWYRPPRLVSPGEALQLTVRLRSPRGLANPGGGDFEGWLYRARIGATGYVRDEHRLEAVPRRLWLLDIRHRLAERVSGALGEERGTAIVLALGLGTRHLLTAEDREVLARTGTSHLMAISGLHIGLVAGLVLLGCRWLWAWLPGPCRRVPPVVAGAWLALLVAAVYAALAGFAIPTRRALLMLAVVLAALCLRRPLRPGRGLALALVVVLLVDPLATLDVSFWLSFVAVAVIVLSLRGRLSGLPEDVSPERRAWLRWRRAISMFVLLQGLIVVGMAPATGIFFAQVPLVSPLANALLVPLFSVLIVPGTLLGMLLVALLPDLGLWWLACLSRLLDALWPPLQGLAALPWSVYVLPALPPVWWLVFSLAAWLALTPRGLPGRWLAVPLLAATLSWRPDVPARGDFQLWLLDVGQGLALVVRTHRHVLLYDAGPAMAEGFDAGRSVILPMLAHQGVARLDKVMLSHGDNDHAGGWPSVRARFPVGRVLVGGADAARFDAEACLTGQRWHWDGVVFEVLHPATPRLRGNEGSCVLSIRAAGGSLLLTGDIEYWGESSLLAAGTDLQHSLVVVPHHGSMTSSSLPLVAAVSADVALVSAGHDNRWNMPRDEVVARWRNEGASVFNTAETGALEIRVSAETGVEIAEGWRERRRRFWHRH
ncbi:MAG: DNA internalization-related competence protein ComEC/Rec2 [Gammaproteobacteria bacterium]|nr:DNA internalization-related competence protein ComEC/Rec2 [Gammaproteobacteria bacterium]